MSETLIPKNTGTSATQVKKTASETISALKMVTATDLNTVELSDPSTFDGSKTMGISITAGNVGEKIKVVTFGEVKDGTFSFALNAPLYLGSGGVITDTPPTSDFSVMIGHALGSGAIFIDIQEPIEFC